MTRPLLRIPPWRTAVVFVLACVPWAALAALVVWLRP